jgi:hypothetical protein
VFEAELIDLDDPRARRHSIELEGSVVVGYREQKTFALRRFDCGAGDRLALRLHNSSLCKAKRYKTHAGDQKISGSTNDKPP